MSDRLAQSPRQAAQRRQLEDVVAAPAVHALPAQRQENRTGMPDGLKSGIESLSGMDMSDVRVHRNSSQPAQLNALAYAQGNDIHLGPGQEQHLPHEAWHVVQQRQGRVEATTQMAGVAVNDDVGLEEEADAMGEKAISGPLQLRTDDTRQDLFAESQAAAQRTLTADIHHGPRKLVQRRQLNNLPSGRRALPWGSTSQLKDLPPDSVGSLKNMPVRGEKEITAQDLQARLITKLKEVGEVGFGYRLVSLKYEKGELEEDVRTTHEEPHGMKAWPVDIAGNLGDIKLLVHSTLQAAGQLEYLEKNAEEIEKTCEVIVDVDWYRERTQSDVGFHKDSRGTTLFVNLTYDNAAKMQGASTKPDLEGQPALESELPPEVQKDLKLRRLNYEEKGLDSAHITEEEVEPYARMSFSDPSVWHSTPLLGHRIEHLPPPTDDVKTLERYLSRCGHDPHFYRGIVKYYETGYDLQKVFDHFRDKKQIKTQAPVQSSVELSSELKKIGYSDEEVHGWQGDYPSPLGFWNALDASDKIDRYNKHGISDKIEPQRGPELTEGVKNKRRPLSIKLDKTPLLQEELNEEAKRPRTFIRTWVRLIKR